MARKSRKNTAQTVKVPETTAVRTFSTAIYVRLPLRIAARMMRAIP